MKLFLPILLWLLLTASACAAPPGKVQASYEVFSRGMQIALTDETYAHSNGSYTLTSTTTPQGLVAIFRPEKIILSSSGQIVKQGLRPLHFEDKAKDSRAEFDWTAKLLTLTHQTLRLQLGLPDDTQDRLSAMYQFMFLQLDKLTAVNFPMTTGIKLDNYHYIIGARQKLNTPAGQFDTLYLDNMAKPGERRSEIWLETQHNLPCKMIITEANGEQFIQILSGLQITP